MTSMLSSSTTADDSDDGDDAGTSSGRRLEETRASLSRVVGGVRSMDAARVLLRIGAIATPLGLLFIFLGYWGAAHAPREIQQTPYLISGGLLGLALVFAGGFAYYTHWVSRGISQQQRIVELLERHTEQLAAQLHSVEQQLSDVRSHLATPAVGSPGDASTTGNGDAPKLLATPTGSIAHRPDCPVVANRSDTHAVDPDDGFGECKICQPLTTA